jgi:glycosyltransferase involved in cell wall biosynthesis
MDVFILPSEGEPFGITLLEASYCKLPIIVFEDGGGAVEVARKIGGIIVKNEEELGEKLKELYLNLQKRKYIGEKGYKCVTTYFPMEKIAQKYKELYLKC